MPADHPAQHSSMATPEGDDRARGLLAGQHPGRIAPQDHPTSLTRWGRTGTPGASLAVAHTAGAALDAGNLPAIPPSTPITASSRQKYLDRVKFLEGYAVRQRSSTPEDPAFVTILDAVNDLLARTDLSAASKLSYRNAMVWYLREQGDQALEFRQAYALLQTMSFAKDPDRASNRKRSIPEADYEALTEQLNEMAASSDWAVRALVWANATLATGARPIEWLAATWDSSKSVLTIQTAKQHLSPPDFRRGGRAPQEEGGEGADQEVPDIDEEGAIEPPLRVEGPERMVPVAQGLDRLMVEQHLTFFNAAIPLGAIPAEREAHFTRYHDQCRQALRIACDRLWKGSKSYTLYTFRGQFQANQRARHGIAATRELMGHSGRVSGRSYGKGNQAFRSIKGERLRSSDRQQHDRGESTGADAFDREAGEGAAFDVAP
ncbi:hypothetical protein [Ramlibacter sp. AN1133]|uniref:hypothetical protein n=1 Tax=Ramlibacter sp. AN1133 TaxID=3133429 RepID=UPI0030C375B4